MAWMVTALLVGLWLLGMVSGATLGAWVHLFLVFALISMAVALAGMSSRRDVA